MRYTFKFQAVIALLAVSICTGCVTQYSSMIRVTPAKPWDPRTPEQLHADINAIMPFEVAPGDFVVSRGMDGPGCWVCFGDDDKTRTFVHVIKTHRDEWKVTEKGVINADCRPMFGLAPVPGSQLTGDAIASSSGI